MTFLEAAGAMRFFALRKFFRQLRNAPLWQSMVRRANFGPIA
jgi:hypothetical protein